MVDCVLCVGVQMAQTFSRCILSSSDEVDLDELLATKLVTFMMDNQEVVLQVPTGLQKSVEEHVSQLRRVQVKSSWIIMYIRPHSFSLCIH